MKKSDTSEPEGTVQEGSDDLHSNQQLRKRQGPTQNESSELCVTPERQKLMRQDKGGPTEKDNNPTQDSLQKTETHGKTSQESRKLAEDGGLEQETIVNVIVQHEVKRSVESPLIGAKDGIKQEADEGTRQECSVFAENEHLEPKINAAVQQRAEKSEKIVIAPARHSIQVSKQAANYAKQECDENAYLETNAALQQKIEKPTKRLILSPKFDKPFEVLEEHEGQERVTLKASIAPEEPSETRVELGARDDKASVRAQRLKVSSDLYNQQQEAKKQLLLKAMSDFFNPKHQVNEQQMEISHQENTHSFDNLKETEPRQIEESEVNRNVCKQDLELNATEYHLQSKDVLARSRESREGAIVRRLDIKEDTKLKYGTTSFDGDPERFQPSQDFVAFKTRESEENPKVSICDLWKSENATVLAPKTKDYVTVLPRELDDATTRLQNSKDHVSVIVQTSDDYILLSSQWKDYVTIHPVEQKDNVRMHPRALPEITEPPTHVLSVVRQFGEIKHSPKSPKRVFWPLQRFPETPSVPFEEGPLTAVQTEEPQVQRNGRILPASLPTGIRDCMQRIREHYILPVWETLLKELCYFTVVGLFSIIIFVICNFLIIDSKTTSSYYLDGNETPSDFDFRVATPVNDFDFRVTTPLNDFDFRVTTPLNDFDFRVTTPLNDFDFRVTTPLNDFDFRVTTPVNDFDSCVTTPVNDFDSRVTTSVNDFDSRVTTPVNDFDVSVASPATNLTVNVVTPIKYILFNKFSRQRLLT